MSSALPLPGAGGVSAPLPVQSPIAPVPASQAAPGGLTSPAKLAAPSTTATTAASKAAGAAKPASGGAVVSKIAAFFKPVAEAWEEGVSYVLF